MTRQTTSDTDSTGLFPEDAAWARTRVLEARAIRTCEFDLEEFSRYRRIRILTYSSSVKMLGTVLDRFAEASVECVLGHSRTVNDMAAVIALQTAAMDENAVADFAPPENAAAYILLCELKSLR